MRKKNIDNDIKTQRFKDSNLAEKNVLYKYLRVKCICAAYKNFII